MFAYVYVRTVDVNFKTTDYVFFVLRQNVFIAKMCVIYQLLPLQTLIGNRYGNTIFAPEIEADEFELLLSYTDQECSPILEHWYKLDDNAVPPVYMLRVRGFKLVWHKQATHRQTYMERSM